MAETGNGTTLTLTDGSYESPAVSILDISWSSSRDSIETSHMGTTTAKTFIPDDLYDLGEITVETEFLTTTLPPIDGAVETKLEIDMGGLGASNKWAGSGFMTGFDISVPMGDRMTATMTWKMTAAFVAIA